MRWTLTHGGLPITTSNLPLAAMSEKCAPNENGSAAPSRSAFTLSRTSRRPRRMPVRRVRICWSGACRNPKRSLARNMERTSFRSAVSRTLRRESRSIAALRSSRSSASARVSLRGPIARTYRSRVRVSPPLVRRLPESVKASPASESPTRM